MNLRIRLIVAFFLLSVVPVGALTYYAYQNNASAMRDAAGAEAELLAGELTQRMQLVTAQLGERVGQLMDVDAAMAAALAPAAATNALPADQPATTVQDAGTPSVPASSPAVSRADTRVAETLSDVAMLLNNIEVRGVRGRGFGRRGGGPPPEGRNGQPPDRSSGPARFNGPPPDAAGRPGGPAPEGAEAQGPRRGGPPPDPSSQAQAAADDDPNRLLFDLMPIRREIMDQLVGTAQQWQELSREERDRIIAEANQRVLGIAQGIEMSRAELQRKVEEAQRAADAKAREVAAAAPTAVIVPPTPVIAAPLPASPVRPSGSAAAGTPAASTSTQRRTALTGSRLGITVEQDGQVVQEANAEINLTNLLATVFTATRRDRGEVPFAIGAEGLLYTPTEQDRAQVEALGGRITDPATPTGTIVLSDWIVVTTNDPTGSGLKFGIARPVGDSLRQLRRNSARNAGFGLGFLLIALVGIVPLSSRLTRNLSSLSDGVRRIAQGDYRARVRVQANDEFGQLAAAFNQMAEDVERHQQAAVEQERIKRELELGRQIQHEMLPRSPLHLGLTEIEGVSVPAREVGGDFFNYFVLDDGRIALLVGDVSGKGVGAALLMANIQGSLRLRLALGQGLATIADEIDIDIGRNTPEPVYATLFVGILDPVSRELHYVNAGHNPQYILRGNGDLERMSSSGLPVGLLSGRGYTEMRVQLASGDLLFFYTDGCVEAENEAGEMLGVDRLEDAIVSAAGAKNALAHVESVITAFRGGRELFDDATIMVVKVG